MVRVLHCISRCFPVLYLVCCPLRIGFAEAVKFFNMMKKHRSALIETVAKYVGDPWNMYDVACLSARRHSQHVLCTQKLAAWFSANVSNQLYAWALD